jgi:hypothetical protein
MYKAATSAMHQQDPLPAMQRLAFLACHAQGMKTNTFKFTGKMRLTSIRLLSLVAAATTTRKAQTKKH